MKSGNDCCASARDSNSSTVRSPSSVNPARKSETFFVFQAFIVLARSARTAASIAGSAAASVAVAATENGGEGEEQREYAADSY
jgi:hypothetical protein